MHIHTQTCSHIYTRITRAHILAEAVMSSIGTFDLIHVGGAASEDMMPKLLSLLAPGGRMVVPVGPPLGLQVRFI